MKVAIFSTKNYDRKYLELVNVKYRFDLEFFDFMLNERTAKMAEGCESSVFLSMMTAAVRYWKNWRKQA